MSFDVLSSTTQVSESFRQISSQKSTDEIFRDWIDMRRNTEFSSENLFVDFERVVGEEWRIASEEFEEKDSESPPISSSAVTSRGDLEEKGRGQLPFSFLRGVEWSFEMYSGVPQRVHVRSLTYFACGRNTSQSLFAFHY